jgi:hypothetical protein
VIGNAQLAHRDQRVRIAGSLRQHAIDHVAHALISPPERPTTERGLHWYDNHDSRWGIMTNH